MTAKQFLETAEYLRTCIEGSKFEGHVYAVGGCMRDYLLSRPIKDIDICVDLPDGGIELAEWLANNFKTHGSVVVYPNFGTAMFRLEICPEEEIEAVQTRKECYRDEGSHNPETSFGTINDDCQRRDFTYNAIYYNISTKEICYFNENSKEDLEKNVLRTCGDPDIIFTEDPLRVIRAVRFACKYNSDIEPKTFGGMMKHARRLEIISKERIQDEITKILTGPYKDRGIQMLYEIDAIDLVFPSIRNHVPDIMHIVHSLQIAESDDLATNLAIVAEECFYPEEDLRYLKFSNDVTKACLDIMDNNINELVNNIPKDELDTPQTIVNLRRFQYKCKSYDNMLKHMKYIYSTSSYYHTMRPEMEALKHLTDQMAEKGCNMFGYKLPVDGNFIMEKKSIKAGPMVKQYLDFLLEIAFYNPHLSKEDCEKILELY